MRCARPLLAHRLGHVRKTIDVGARALRRQCPGRETRRLAHEPIHRHPVADGTHVAGLIGIVCGQRLLLVGAEWRKHLVHRLRRREADVGAVGADEQRQPRVVSGAIDLFRRFDDDGAVDHRATRVGGVRRAHRREVQAGDHLFGRHVAQRRERRRVGALDPDALRECHADRFGRHRSVGHVLVQAAHRQQPVAATAGLDDRLVQQPLRRR